MARSRYGVKTSTLKFGEKTYEMSAGPAGKSVTREAIEVTSLEDTVKQFIRGSLKEIDEFTVTLFQGSADITEDAAPAVLQLDVVLENGEDEDIQTSVVIGSAAVTKVTYPNHEGSGDRKATYDVTFRPTGVVSAS